MDTECLIDNHVPNVEHDHIMRQARVRVREYRPRGRVIREYSYTSNSFVKYRGEHDRRVTQDLAALVPRYL